MQPIAGKPAPTGHPVQPTVIAAFNTNTTIKPTTATMD